MKKLILGTVQFGLDYGVNNPNGRPSVEEVQNILAVARNHSLLTIDTADAYGDSQEVLANLLSPQHLVLSKFILEKGKTLSEIFEKTRQRLKVQNLYGYSFHRFSDFKQSTGEELVSLKSKRLIQNIGVSLYHNEELDLAIETPWIDMIQVPFNLLDNKNRKGSLLQKAKAKGKTIHVRSVFLQGLFFRSLDALPDRLKPLHPYLEKIHSLARENQISIEDLSLLYALSQNEIDGVVIGVDSLAQLNNNLKSVEKEKLSSTLLEEIQQLDVKEVDLLNPSNWSLT